ncbi:hypothetical protein [Microcoleus sp.]|uniref:hypothetical protein n=1 Tax=Microcoleus sp. TaxID=44472 RepID=UPI0035254855
MAQVFSVKYGKLLTNSTVADISPIARPDKTALGTKRRFVTKLVSFCTHLISF